ncbi:hypothetical protein M9H77_10261 [Catharanthus roseus]|uniref:Uncharacterized protein n=1 Tax=Catharanthus roseus TaxID=4058 RepID=A0ACC0C337_CATRO|nr:hypothetical protein M9H77_10261 [Catharanthus roseus]
MNDEAGEKSKIVPHNETELLLKGKNPLDSDKATINEVAEAGNSGTVKTKKKKAKKSAAKLEDKSDVENLLETSLPARGLTLDVEMNDEAGEKSKIVPHNETELLLKGKNPLDSDKATINEVAEAGNSGTVKTKKKKAKKSAAKLEDKSDVENLLETSLPARGLTLDVEMNDEAGEKSKIVPHNETQLLLKGKNPLDSDKATINEVAEAGNSGTVKTKKKKAKKSAAKLEDKSDVENLLETSLPARGLTLDVEMNDEAGEKSKIVPHNETQLLLKGKNPLDSDKATINEVAEAGNSGTIKTKKKKAKKSAAKLQDKSDVENLLETSLPARGLTLDVEMNDEAGEESKIVPHNETQLLLKGKIPLDSDKATINEVAEAGNSGTVKTKKKKAKKSAAKLQDKSDVENLLETSLPARGLTLDVEMNDEAGEKSKIVPHNETELLLKGKIPLDSDKATMNVKEAGFVEMSVDDIHGSEAGKYGGSHKKKRVRNPPATNDDLSSMEHSNPVYGTPAKHFESKQGLPFKQAQEVISYKASKSFDLDEATVRGSESEFAAPLVNNEDGLRAGKSGGGQKKQRGKKQATSRGDSHVKHSAYEGQGNQSILSHAEVRETAKEESRNASISGAGKVNEASQSEGIVSSSAETDQTQENSKDPELNVQGATIDESVHTDALQDRAVKVQANEVQHLDQEGADKEQENAGNIRKKVEKKNKRNQNTAAETPSNSKYKERIFTSEELAASGDKLCGHPYDTTNASISAETRTGNVSAVPVLLEKNAGVKSKYSNPEQVPKGANSSSVPSYHTLENNLELRPETTINVENIVEPSKAGEEGIDFRRYFFHGEHQTEVVSAKKTPMKATNTVNNGSGSSKTMPSGLEENNGSGIASSSSFTTKDSKKALQDTSNSKRPSEFNNGNTSARKLSRKNDGDIVNSSQQKSLLTSAGAIFSDTSSESAAGDYGVENSDASTRTPSDSSSSSGHSAGESELSLDLKGDETSSDRGCKSTLISRIPSPKEMSMDMILRSSQRFKKAKLTASQSQDLDPESQPVDFVPDSQAN